MKFFTVGPVEMYPDTLQVGKNQIPYFRNQSFSNMMFELDNNLKYVLNMCKFDKNIFLTTSGTGAMEATILNCLNQQDKVLIISGGSFGERFEQLCKIYNIPFDVLRIPYGMKFEESMFENYQDKAYTALLVNIHETSIGQLYPIKILSDFCKKYNLMFIVDGISSVFADEINFCEYEIDALIFSSHKALALPPGISIVSLSERMCRKINTKPLSMYFDFNLYIKNGLRGQTPFTPSIGILMQMNDMIKKIKEEGIENKVFTTRQLAEDFRNKMKEVSFKIPLYPLSNAMTPVLFDSDAKIYYQKLIDEYDITVNPCGGELTDKMLRVGHMGNLTIEDNDTLVKAFCNIRGEIC